MKKSVISFLFSINTHKQCILIFKNIDYLRSQYNIEDFIYFDLHKRDNHIHLYHFVINPIFAYLTKIFLKEVLRKTNKTSVYYPIFPRYADDEVYTSIFLQIR